MKYPRHDDEVQHLREQFGLRTDAAAKSVTEALHAAADLFLAIAKREAVPPPRTPTAEPVVAPSVPAILTSAQAAEYLGIEAQTLAVWRMSGRNALPFVKVGRNVRYRKSDLDKSLQSRTVSYGQSPDSR